MLTILILLRPFGIICSWSAPKATILPEMAPAATPSFQELNPWGFLLALLLDDRTLMWLENEL
jgi:hypothetical protein